MKERGVSGTRERVTYQVNQIARNFDVLGQEEAAAATASHIRSFWAPYLRWVLQREFDRDQGQFSPTAQAAVMRLRQQPALAAVA
jgi:formate dehydrogenase subunit delta